MRALRRVHPLALACALAVTLPVASARAQADVAPDLRARALLAALRARAARVADSALVDGCRVWAGDTTTTHGEALGTYLRDSLRGTQVTVRTCYDGYRDPHAHPGVRTTRLRLDAIGRRGDTVEIVLRATRPREWWRERLTMRLDTSGAVAFASLRSERQRRFPTPPRLPAPGAAGLAALREAVVVTALAHLWDSYGHLGDDTTAVRVLGWNWRPTASRWLQRVAKAHGVTGDTLRASRRARVVFGSLAIHGDSAEADVSLGGGQRCPGTNEFIGSETGYVYVFRRVDGEWRFVSRRAEGHGDAINCPIVGRPR